MMVKDCKFLIWITSYPYGTSFRKVGKKEVLGKYKWLILMIILNST